MEWTERRLIAMAVLGMENQQNLFVTADEGWDAGVYLPVYVRRYPFCMTRVTVDGQEQPERVACVEKRAISDKGEPLAMTGMYRVSEEKLAGLAPEKLKELTRKGILARVYAHLISLSNFGRLLDRRAAQAKPAPAPTHDRKKLN